MLRASAEDFAVRHAPIDLDAITIRSPCTVPWESMKGNERRRFCDRCRLHVHDVSELTPREAVALLRRTGGDVCLRVWRRPDGRVVTKDCGRVRVALERRMRWLRAAAAAVLATLGLGGCRSSRVADSPSPPPAPSADGSHPATGSPPPPPPPVAPRPDGARPSIGR